MSEQVALVTGGARGQGAAHAEALALAGVRVIIADVRDEDGAETAEALNRKELPVRYAHLDVTDELAWPALISDIEAREGGLDVLVNNAGIMRVASLSDLSIGEWDLVQRVNVTSVVLGIRAAAPAMTRRGGGSIINVASTAAHRGAEGYAAYAASKAAVLAVTRAAALELAPHGIRVNAISPGGVETPMNDDEPPGGTSTGAPLGRRARPEEISPLVVYLASKRFFVRHGSRLPDRRRSDDPMTDQVALVTGAGSGMGRATAEVFLERGWTVLALDLAPVEIDATGGRLVPITADVRDRDALDAALREHVPDVGGTIHALANVAGIYPPSTLETTTAELFHRVFDVNVLGVINVTAAALPYLVEGSAIVNFASVDGFAVSPGQLVYGASKAAVIMLTKEMALELAPRRIRVNAIAPGWVDTPGNAATGRMEAAAASIPLGRVARPSEIAEWVWILTSDAAAFMTGETVTLSGGDVIR